MINIPNILSILRLAAAPVLIYLAWSGNEIMFLLFLGCAIISDGLDGFIARNFDLASDLGAKLDTWADVAIYFSLAISAYLLWRESFIAEKVYFGIMFLSIVFPAAAGLMKFGKFTSYHTWMVKLAAPLAMISCILLFIDISPWPFRFAAILAGLAGLEQVAITMILNQPKSNVRTIWHVRQSKRAE